MPTSPRRPDHNQLLDQLSAQSVEHHHDAFADIDWDSPENRIEPHDPRWILTDDEPLGASGWYHAQPERVRARLGLHLVVHQMKLGIAFENVLSRGLLEFAFTRPDQSPDFRYAYHEVIEEGQHSLMFQEFINRSGLHAPGLTGLDRLGARFVPALGRDFPELFFLFVLGGEEPIDRTQRHALRRPGQHPLLEQIQRIHVIEEARHLRFAHSYLQTNVPRLSALRMLHLRVRVPFIFGVMTRQMLEAPRHIVRRYGIPRDVITRSYRDNPAHRTRLLDSLSRIRALCQRLSIVTPRTIPLWRYLGIWPDEQPLRLGATT